MAREYGAIHHRIWADPEWRALDADAQLLYFLLISQPAMNQAGVLPLQLRKWSGCVDGWGVDTVTGALHRLHDARFLVLDEDFEEVLVRSFIRNDGSFRIPGVLKSALKFAVAVQSPAIRSALAAELGRLPELEGKTAAAGMASIAAVRAVLEPIGDPFPDPIRDPIPDGFLSKGSPNPSPMGDFTAESPIPEPIGEPPLSGSGSVSRSSLESSWGGEAPARGQQAPTGPLAPTAPRCIKHSQLRHDEDAPPCRTCQRLRLGWEAQRDAEIEQQRVERDKPRPMCDKHHGQTASGCGPCRSERIAAPEQEAS